MTDFEKITASPEVLAAFLESIQATEYKKEEKTY